MIYKINFTLYIKAIKISVYFNGAMAHNKRDSTYFVIYDKQHRSGLKRIESACQVST